jgi:hypothetical protein
MHSNWKSESKERILEEMELLAAINKEYMLKYENLLKHTRDLCFKIGNDGSINEKAFDSLCKLAAQCGCTNCLWWDSKRG